MTEDTNTAAGSNQNPEHEFGVFTLEDMSKAQAGAAPSAAPSVVSEPVPLATSPALSPMIPESAPAASPKSASAPAAEPFVAPAAAPAQEQAAIPVLHTIPTEEITELVASTKLPERHEFHASADVKKPEPEAKIVETRPVEPVAPKRPPVMQAPGTPSGGALAPEHASSIVTPVHTLKDDLQDVVREKKMSLVRAVALETEKRHGQDRVAPQRDALQQAQRRRIITTLFIAFVLFALGGAALFGVYVVMQQKANPPQTAQTVPSILFAETTLSLPLSNTSISSIKQQLVEARGGSIGVLGSITRILPVFDGASGKGGDGRVATTQEFFKAIGVNPPSELMRALDANFFFGIHVVDKNAPILIIPVVSYDRAFAGMLAWEPTMNADLAPIFTAVPALKTGENGLPVQRTFQDVVLRNYDTRALEDDANQIQLYYSFPNPHILVIAESPYSFAEILARLQASRKLE